MKKRQIILVLDSVGIGEAEDASKFGDVGAYTLGNISKEKGLSMPNMANLGLGEINEIKTISSPKELSNHAYYTHMKPVGVGKDSVAGHWEMMGATLKSPFKVFIENGFPKELIDAFEKETGLKVIGNKEANGMKIIQELAHTQKETGAVIVYTSVDSTFQIAAHEEWIGLDKLYEACHVARRLTLENPEWMVSRVIARPFVGENGEYTRTGNRHDYALNPFSPIALSSISTAGLDVISVGKINDLFNGVGITKSIATQSNQDGIDKTIELLKTDFEGLLFVNLVEFDSVYGHPRDPKGYKNALEQFDQRLPEILNAMHDTDILFITADHGNDPTFKGNDHTRENVPLIVYSKSFNASKSGKLTVRNGFADLGKTVADIFDVDFNVGQSFKNELK